MTNTTATHVREVPSSGERKGPIRLETHEVRYLDMSGDGVPDAVEHIDRSFRGRDSDTVEVKRRLAYGIGIDGKPAGVTERTTIFVRDEAGRFNEMTRSDCESNEQSDSNCNLSATRIASA
jgi:hypothetical protein